MPPKSDTGAFAFLGAIRRSANGAFQTVCDRGGTRKTVGDAVGDAMRRGRRRRDLGWHATRPSRTGRHLGYAQNPLKLAGSSGISHTSVTRPSRM
jgi:hypothetical protein